MFRSIVSICNYQEQLVIRLKDSQFGNVDFDYSTDYMDRARHVIEEYSRRNLPVTKNLVLYYSWFWGHYNMTLLRIDRDKDLLDQHHPNLQYGTKYYPCVKRQFKRLAKIS